MSRLASDSRFVRLARDLEAAAIEYGPTILVAIAGLGWTLGRTWILESPVDETLRHCIARWAAGIFLSLAGLIGAVLAYRRSGSIKRIKEEKADLEDEIESLQNTILRLTASAKDAWRVRLANILFNLELDDTFRISLYRYSAETRTFNMIGRYSRITKYAQVGRGIYPAEVGCIGEAWDSPNLEAIADDLPEADDEYIAVSCERWNFDEETVKGLAMKSRSVYAFTIMDALNMDRTAVVVFESTEPNAANADTLRDAVHGIHRQQILADLESLKFIEPSPELAKDAGF